ncbi:AraC family transcriptional regulator [Spirillospora sp. CA-294931]|uniref:AraC family transcriptional regulator n=1 Tax=Spirillospora sp. CA-294931 TaxID=3240042 RepID=UPI003D91156C
MEQLTGTADELSVLLDGVRVSATRWCRASVSPPWGIAVAALHRPVFWLPVRGGSWFETDTGGRFWAATGDVVVVTHGSAHRLRDDPASPIGPDDIHQRSTADDRTELLCGDASLGGARLPAVLPDVLHLPREHVRAGSLDAVLADRSPGSAAVVARTTEDLLLRAVRHHGPGVDTDPAVLAALRLIRAEPARAWTVTELAATAGMSRSVFAARFAASMGEPPMRYLTRYRMTRAAAHLRGGDLPLRTIARLTGYDSEAALSRAFRRSYGVPPSAYRTRPSG